MKTLRLLAMLVSILVLAPAAVAETVADLPLHVKRLGPKAVRVWVGDFISSTATVAVATEKGVVVVDTLGIPKLDAELRKVIARELGRNDFRVLINTHEHGDHTGGNSVYADCMIVGHELVAAGMAAQVTDRDRIAGWMKDRIAELEAEQKKELPGTPAARRLHEELLLERLNRDVVLAAKPPVPPTTTFSDRMVLGMGDTTFEMYFIGGMHSASDIAVFVPEAELLLTGDTMADVWLTDTPGCLASFSARPGVRHDFPLLLKDWDLLLQKKDRFHQILPGHWNGTLSLAGLEARVGYVRTLWEGVGRAAAEGKSLGEIQNEYRLDRRFPDLAQSPGFNPNTHFQTVQEIYIAATGLESAAASLYSRIDEGAGAEAIQRIVAGRDAKPAKYFYQEREITGAGYRFLQEGKVEQAVRMFEAYVAIFPEAWNAYDSLGEALWNSGDAKRAEAMYEKSVALNPENRNGVEALKKIRAGERPPNPGQVVAPPPPPASTPE